MRDRHNPGRWFGTAVSGVIAVAKVVILRSWPDDDDLQVIVEVDASYPDALSEASRTALNTFAEAMGVTLAGDGDE